MKLDLVKIKSIVFISILFLGFIGCSQNNSIAFEATYPIIPVPNQISFGDAEIKFKSINISTIEFKNEKKLLTNFFKTNDITSLENGLHIQLIKENISVYDNEEAYKISISDSIIIAANSDKGIFYGIQTLKQIFRKNKAKGVFPKVDITDIPAFKIRGFMHDTGRNFQSVAQIKEQIEILSQYKYNVFHWHLTDNPGWRLESKMYPELQSEEATTRQKGDFYTQEDFKDIIAFCKERKITVIPEFDIPGHTDAFRKALQIDEMRNPKVKPILLNLFQELMNLAAAETMPYIHIGTDEVRNDFERVSKDDIFELMQLIKKNNREVIVWKEGIVVEKDSTSINQLWAYHEGTKGHRFIDSRSNYINHLDPFAGMARLFFQQPARQPKGDALALGGILAAWPDNNIHNERDILKQNPIYPSMVFYADAIWNGRAKDYPEYWAKLPSKKTQEFKDFKTFEEKVIAHRDLFFKGKEFQYIKQTDKNWKLIGPFNHKGNVEKSFPVEERIKETYEVDGEEFSWTNKHVGGTIHLKHFFGFESVTKAKQGTYYAYTNIYSLEDSVQDFWVGFQGWSRSGGRRVGPFPDAGDWHTTKPKIWVNNTEIAPPLWKQPNLGTKTEEIPFIDEDYFFRSPTKITLKKGWNKVLLKIPQDNNSWKWMFTCIPVNVTKDGFREVTDLKYSTNFNNN
ncbi:family 20 glycosylhydrolase [Polaribacter sp. ALD11]|uniref:family 20 glycosylhydrolase n=1 Tax=Polaribacter sp. ALD11 TaxID=2058137 RepID=UPI0018E1E2DE|nr:family 20 glycosylhydrolase [Polaribacter sp. ALD11]